MSPQIPKRGRPATGRSPVIAVTVAPKIAARIDRSAADHFESRRDAARRLLVQGLEAERGPSARSGGRA